MEDKELDISDKEFWKKQYELLITAMYQESNRFWSRFQVSLILNGGLLVAFAYIFIGKLENIEELPLKILVLVIISGIGVFTGSIWFKLTRSGSRWQDYWMNKGIKLESTYLKRVDDLKIFSDIPSYEINNKIRNIASWIPLVFIGGWVILVFSVVLLHP